MSEGSLSSNVGPISIVAMMQVGTVVAETMFVAARTKGYPVDMPGTYFSGLVLFIRNYGFTMLLLPCFWVVGQLLLASRVNRLLQQAFFLAGVAAIPWAIWTYASICANPITVGIR